MNKTRLVWTAVMFLVIGFAVYQYRQDEFQKMEKIEAKKVVNWRLLDLIELKVMVDGRVLSFVPKNGPWWMASPYEFPANQEVLFATFEMMAKVLSDEAFKTNKDSFGFKSPRGLITLINRDGRRQVLTIGSKDAPGNKIYVRNSLDNVVYVVHNAWAQLLHQPVENYLMKRIFIGLKEIEKFEYFVAGENKWSAQKVSSSEWALTGQGKKAKLGPKEILGLWQKIAKVKLAKHRFETPLNIKGGPEFRVSSKDGETIKISFNEKLDQVNLHHLSVAASVEPEQVKTVIALVEKVLLTNGK